jgi:hypothetical protein
MDIFEPFIPTDEERLPAQRGTSDAGLEAAAGMRTARIPLASARMVSDNRRAGGVIRLSVPILALLSLMLVSPVANSQRIWSTQGRAILVTDAPGMKAHSFLTAKGLWVLEMKVARQGTAIGILSAEYRYVEIDTTKKAQVIAPILEIVDSAGNKLREYDIGIQSFAFSPDGRRVAFITGQRQLEGAEFVPLGFGIADIAGDSIEWVRRNDSGHTDTVGNGVHWLADDTIITNDGAGNILRMDARTRQTKPVGVKGRLQVSPDGRHNLLNGAVSAEDRYIELVDLVERKNISPDIYLVVGESFDRSDYGWSLFATWLGDSGSFLAVNMGDKAFIIDVGKRSVIFDDRSGEYRFDVSGGAAEPSCWLVRRRGVLTVLDKSSIVGK